MEKKLQVKHLSVSFATDDGKLEAVRDISFTVKRGETLAIVGESGSGKSVTTRAILGLPAGNATIESGEILYDGRDLLTLPESEMNRLRGDRIAMIFQDPLSCLDPIVRVGRQLTEAMLLKNRTRRRTARAVLKTALRGLHRALSGADPSVIARLHDLKQTLRRGRTPDPAIRSVIAMAIRLSTITTGVLPLPDDSPTPAATAEEWLTRLENTAAEAARRITPAAARARALSLMEEVGITEPRRRFRQYPFELSGGMRQRVVIAIALVADPDLLICDEPTTALDVTIQARILELINRLKAERGLSVIFITHDLGVVANMADRIAVMYAGRIVETGTAEDIFYRAAHPYTWALLGSVPDPDTDERLAAIPGTPPTLVNPPPGDAFAPRNPYALRIDFEEQPPEFRISDTHTAATWLLHPDAPKITPPEVLCDRIRRMREKYDETYGPKPKSPKKEGKCP